MVALLGCPVLFSSTSTFTEFFPASPDDGEIVSQFAETVADQATLVLKLSVIDCSALSTEMPEVTMSSVNLISGVISGSFSVPVPPQPAISVAMATALRKVSNFLIMVLNINFLLIVFNYLEGLQLVSRRVAGVRVNLPAFLVIDEQLRDIDHIQTSVKIPVSVVQEGEPVPVM